MLTQPRIPQQVAYHMSVPDAFVCEDSCVYEENRGDRAAGAHPFPVETPVIWLPPVDGHVLKHEHRHTVNPAMKVKE
jgi:hypothetical protein